MIDFDKFKSNLNDLVIECESDSERGDRNEAQTRFDIIDKVLLDCLDWSREETKVERSFDGKYTDYELGRKKLAVVEAKKEGLSFKIPSGTIKNNKIKLSTLFSLEKSNIKEAVIQAKDYCSERGIQYGIVTNGHQYICFLASRTDGVPVKEGIAIAFISLRDMLENFELAWESMSKHGLEDSSTNQLFRKANIALPKKLSSKLIDYPKFRYKNDLQSNLAMLSELFIQDVANENEIEKKFYEECYCESGALSKYSLISKNILKARYANLFPNNESSPNLQSVKDKKGLNITSTDISSALSKRPIILMGDVGVGKTSFVKNLIISEKEEIFANSLYVYIDLGVSGILADNIESFVVSEIKKQFIEKGLDVEDFNFLKGVYASELSKFATGRWGFLEESDPKEYHTKIAQLLDEKVNDLQNHLKRSIEYYTNSNQKQVVVFIDNADQRSYEDQQSAFLASQELAINWKVIVFISVRPNTFYESKMSGALSAYPTKVFTISPPRIEEMLDKRLRFAIDLAKGSDIPLRKFQNIHVNAENIEYMIKAILMSLSYKDDIYAFLINITGGNVRSVLEFITKFIGNGNVDANKIIRIMKEQGKYYIPIHEFTKAALLGDFSHYDPKSSIAMNVFDISYPDKNEYFLCLIALAYLNFQDSPKDKDNFMDSQALFDELQSLGYSSEQIETCITKMINKKIIDTSERITFKESSSRINPSPNLLRISSVGAYHFLKWVGDFTYLDAMLFDTPILDASVNQKLLDNIDGFDISIRYLRAVIFRDYLLDCWKDIDIKPIYFDFSQLVDENSNSFEKVNSFVDSNA